ncbi:MAG: sodium:calcium antiporter, partial [Clostridia bacterium]|nr:sodium:calcium antiporter [Clostridia bacterium]
MEIAVAVLLFFVAIFLVVKGGDIFVESSTQIAKRLKIPQIIFGATVVSLATTLPELIITILSSIDGTNGLAVGNSVGSALCNIGLTCGISFIAMTLDISKDGVLKYYLNLFVFLIILIFGLFMELTLWQGIVLVGL